MAKVLITGGAGFIGSHYTRLALREHDDWEVTVLDKLTYAGNLDNLKDIESNSRFSFVKGDICDKRLLDGLLGQSFDILVNFAAESHVDRSIQDATPFVRTNVEGTQVLLDAARQHEVALFLQVSTDEVYRGRGDDDPSSGRRARDGRRQHGGHAHGARLAADDR